MKSVSGMALLEALVAVGLATVVIVAGMNLASQSASFSSQQKETRLAYIALQNMTEALVLSSGSDGVLEEGTHTRYFDPEGNPATDGPLRVEWTVQKDFPLVGISNINVQAYSSSSGGGKARSYRFFRNNPPEDLSTSTRYRTVRIPGAPPPTSPSPAPAAPSWSPTW